MHLSSILAALPLLAAVSLAQAPPAGSFPQGYPVRAQFAGNIRFGPPPPQAVANADEDARAQQEAIAQTQKDDDDTTSKAQPPHAQPQYIPVQPQYAPVQPRYIPVQPRYGQVQYVQPPPPVLSQPLGNGQYLPQGQFIRYSERFGDRSASKQRKFLKQSKKLNKAAVRAKRAADRDAMKYRKAQAEADTRAAYYESLGGTMMP
ncbi:MAG: hypothetical protein DHS80DRAFT_33693 [Piptocephalis tieghemiana]|nr:MAG: hypothetical protein DHS80DRAFT_33693 [Piptocephalis tieghemiana]